MTISVITKWHFILCKYLKIAHIQKNDNVELEYTYIEKLQL
jgi:hypothetical protein